MIKILSWLWEKLTSSSTKDNLYSQKLYRGIIEDIKKQLEERDAIIAEFKKKHPENGIEYSQMNEWVSELSHRLIAANKVIMELEEMIIFLRKSKGRLNNE